MTNTSTNQPYLTVRDLIEMLSDPSVDKDGKVCWLDGTDTPRFPGGLKQKFVTPVGGNSPIKVAALTR